MTLPLVADHDGCVVWYSTVTVYVAFKGIADIQNMLTRLAKGRSLD